MQTSISLKNKIHCLALIQNDQIVLLGQEICISSFDMQKNKIVEVFNTGCDVSCLKLSKDKSILFAGGIDGMISVLKAAKLEKIYEVKAHYDRIVSFAISDELKYFVSFSVALTNVWEFGQMRAFKEIQIPSVGGYFADYSNSTVFCTF